MTQASVVDLHCHSTASDGALAPAAVVERAAGNGVRVLAVTDHDTVAGLASARAAARAHGIVLVDGLELSVRWGGHTLHIVGLRVDPEADVLREVLARQLAAREDRAERIAAKLRRAGVEAPLEGARREAGEGAIGRVHFARHLVACGVVDSLQAAFRRYLRRGQRAHVACRWVSLEEGVAAIRAAGGQAVLAHPTKYGFTRTLLRRACEAFHAAGGEAIEVITGGGGPGDVDAARTRAEQYGLLASVGSDFHDPERRWNDLGRLRPLPSSLTPVWQSWPAGCHPEVVS